MARVNLDSSPSFLFVLTILSLIDIATALPVRGNDPWTVLLCKFKDNDHEPHSREWVQAWIDGPNPDSIALFFYSLSNGVYTIDGTNVTTWIQIPWTRDDVVKLAREEKGDNSPFAMFDKAKQLCAGWAAVMGIRARPRRVTLLNSESTAVFGRTNGVLISPRLAFSSVLAHEMVHSMNIGHSYSERKRMVFPHGAPGEYGDRFDLMSTANAWMHSTRFGWAGPGLAGPHLDYLGWLPHTRMVYFGGNSSAQVIRLSSLSVPHSTTNGQLLIMIPYDRKEPANVFTVELRTPHGNDAGIQQPAVLIHNVKRVGGAFYSYLIAHKASTDEFTEGTEWMRLIDNGQALVRVQIDRFTSPTEALILVQSTFDPTRCGRGERSVPVVLSESEKRNGERQSGKVYHEHEKLSIVRVCMDPENPLRSIDIEYEKDMKQFFKRKTFGQSECVYGKVWRAIDPYDYVCVSPHRVYESWRAVVPRRRDGRCPYGYSRRRAHDRDQACVSGHERALIISENIAAQRNYKHASFFNGDDSLMQR